jgi:hypothetical protein
MTLQAWGLTAGSDFRGRARQGGTIRLRLTYLLLGATLFLTLCLGLPLKALADDVGTFTQVIGQVDLVRTKDGKVIPVKVKSGAEEKDEIDTKPLSRAELQFIDDSMLTVAPSSRITIESYMYDREKGVRKATSKVMSGLIHGVVTKLFKAKETQYIIKTPTAVIGIRGTEFFLIVSPKFTDVLVREGTVYCQSSSSNISGTVAVGTMEATRIGIDQAPTPAIAISAANLTTVGAMMNIGLPAVLPPSTTPAQLLTQIQQVCLPPAYTYTAPAGETPAAATSETASTANEPTTGTTGTSSLSLGGGGGGGGTTPAPTPTSTSE